MLNEGNIYIYIIHNTDFTGVNLMMIVVGVTVDVLLIVAIICCVVVFIMLRRSNNKIYRRIQAEAYLMQM